MLDHIKRWDWDFLHTSFVGAVGFTATGWDTVIARTIALSSALYMVTKVVLLFHRIIKGKSTKDDAD